MYELPLFKLPLAEAELKARPSEGFISVPSCCPELGSGSDHSPARGRDKWQLGDQRESPICALGSVWLGSDPTALLGAAEPRRVSAASAAGERAQPALGKPSASLPAHGPFDLFIYSPE